MCGIIGYAGQRDGTEEVLCGLTGLEYRGYDSAGLATIGPHGGLSITRSRGGVESLRRKLDGADSHVRFAIGHTRWATHGVPDDRNAHPHVDCQGRIAVVHNGIVENAGELRRRLASQGHTLHSDTDTECIAHLIEDAYTGDLEAAVREATAQLVGNYALAVVARDEDCIVATRRGSPLIVGVGEGEFMLASDVLPILARTQEVIYLEDGHVAAIRGETLTLRDDVGDTVPLVTTRVEGSVEDATRAGFETYMRKEIDDQPAAIGRCLQGRLVSGVEPHVVLRELEALFAAHGAPRRVIFAACGTSLHASLAVKNSIEQWCGVPVDVQVASELRYGGMLGREGDLLIAVSQSGETADTLACVEMAQSRGVPVLAVCNVAGSSLARCADATLLTRAGPEVSVASTKAFTTQCVTLQLVAAWLAPRTNDVDPDAVTAALDGLAVLPALIRQVIDTEPEIAVAAMAAADSRLHIFLGRGLGHAVALEGALKLAELSYLPAVGYAAGEIKHGPLAMVDALVNVVCVLPSGTLRRKMLCAVSEVRARGGRVLAIGARGQDDVAALGDSLLELPGSDVGSEGLLAAVALQLFALHVARHLGRDIDRPRNLAKSVTVE